MDEQQAVFDVSTDEEPVINNDETMADSSWAKDDLWPANKMLWEHYYN